MNMNTTENNKLIAEFMGYQVLGICCDTYPKYEEVESLPILEDMFRDWNELMEVVEKIESLGYSVYISPSMVYINGNIGTIIHPIIIGDSLSKIEAVYNACVEFIKWHNTQKL